MNAKIGRQQKDRIRSSVSAATQIQVNNLMNTTDAN